MTTAFLSPASSIVDVKSVNSSVGNVLRSVHEPVGVNAFVGI